MPRIDQIYAHEERALYRRTFGAASHALVTTTIIPHERNDVPGRTCPCCGSETARELGRVDDLAVLINRQTGARNNRWDQHTGDGTLELFDSKATLAQPWGTADALVWQAPIIYRCTESQVDALTDDHSEVILFTGGWRSGKTFLSDMWWTRGWVKFGGRGEIFWLVSPALMRTWKNMRKIFFGKESDPPLLPTYVTPGGARVPILASSFPEKHTSSHMHFNWLDGSRGELYHAGHGHGGHLEGDDVRRVQFDEAARVREKDAFEVLRGRVAQSLGALGLATVPDDEGPWIYDEIVQPIEQKTPTAANMRMVVFDSYDNVFVAREAIERLEAGTNDPKTRAEKIRGQWQRGNAFAYGDTWSQSLIVDTNSHDPEAWGFRADVTKIATKVLLGTEGCSYIAGADSNWSPQTCIVGKIFGDPEHPRTWALCWLDEIVLDGDSEMAARALAEKDGGRYRGRTLVVCDANMFRNSQYHGGHSTQSNDAAEYKRLGFRTKAPITVDGTKHSNPNVLEARKLVRIMQREGVMLFSAVGCPQLVQAMPKVPSRVKAHAEAGSRMDRQVYNFDDSLRYPAWRLFQKRWLPQGVGQGVRVA
ncbi:MAG: hypothetical protein IPH07_24350 [Deltaproteobacteria bacterium]|nr:hypothetical protein [Deltaproteobacteria bacterium]